MTNRTKKISRLQKLTKLNSYIGSRRITGIIEIYCNQGGIREIKRRNRSKSINLK